MTQRTYMYVVLYHYTCYNLCHSSMIDSSHLLWDFKIMSFDWTIVSSARDVCQKKYSMKWWLSTMRNISHGVNQWVGRGESDIHNPVCGDWNLGRHKSFI